MRILTALFIFSIFTVSCGKDKFTTEPQIEFVSLKPDSDSSTHPIQLKEFAPKLTIKVRDAEGDLGAPMGREPSKIYIKNLSSGNIDSFPFPSLGSSASSNLKIFVDANLYDCMDCLERPRPYTDTTFYEVFVTDLARNKSNVIVTEKPLYLLCK